ncbi:hypothetical protein OMR07_06420 [Methylobacterium organophilum]|nr:hypothetical protein [Methylobacterium organophilum]
MERLICFFGAAGSEMINFINLAIDAVGDEARQKGRAILEKPVNLGTSFSFGEQNQGSGFALNDIAASWLNKVSMLQSSMSLAAEAAQDMPGAVEVIAATLAPARKEKKIVPAVKDELRSIAPQLSINFEKEFHFNDRKVPVKLNYSGERLVADFDRVSPKNIGGSLERVRSKLWVLAEHRDRTRHEVPRLHEMLVVPTTKQDAIIDQTDMRIVNEACDDIEHEADRREIRFRRFSSTRDLAAHIFRIESGQRPELVH